MSKATLEWNGMKLSLEIAEEDFTLEESEWHTLEEMLERCVYACGYSLRKK